MDDYSPPKGRAVTAKDIADFLGVLIDHELARRQVTRVLATAEAAAAPAAPGRPCAIVIPLVPRRSRRTLQ